MGVFEGKTASSVLSSSLYPHVFVGLIMYTIVRKFQFSTEKEPSGTNGPRSQNTSCLFMVREHRGDTASSGKYGGRCMFCEPLVKKYQYVRFMCVAGGAWSFQSSMHHPQAPALTHPFCAKHHVCIAGRRGSPRSRDSGASDCSGGSDSSSGDSSSGASDSSADRDSSADNISSPDRDTSSTRTNNTTSSTGAGRGVIRFCCCSQHRPRKNQRATGSKFRQHPEAKSWPDTAYRVYQADKPARAEKGQGVLQDEGLGRRERSVRSGTARAASVGQRYRIFSGSLVFIQSLLPGW